MEIRKQIVYAGSKVDFDEWLYKGVALSALSAILIYIAVFLHIPSSLYAGTAAFLTLIFFFGARIVLVMIEAKKRAREVERVLPDFLELVAGNIESGMSAFDALNASKRPEFGPLNEEIDHALKRVKTTKSLPKAFSEMSSRIDSKILSRISRLFTTGVRSGAPLGAMLEEIASDTREFLSLRRETVNSVTAYSSFILLATVIGGPFLFASSIHFLGALDAAAGGFALSETPIIVPEIGDISMMETFSYIMMGISSFFVSLLFGLVREGDEKNGIKYVPLILGGSVGFFYLSLTILRGFAPL